MGNSEEKHRHEINLKTLKNIEDDNKRKRETERYIEENNLKIHMKEIDRFMKQDEYKHEEEIENLSIKREEMQTSLENKRKADEEMHEREKEKIEKLHEEKMKEIEYEKIKNDKENARLTEEMHLKNENDKNRINNEYNLASKKLEEDSKNRELHENHRHEEEIEKINTNRLEIEKKNETEKEKIKLEMQQRQHQHEELMSENQKNLTLQIKKIDEGIKKIEEDNKLKIHKFDKKLEETKLREQNSMVTMY